jgi:hypothetical protein
MSQKMMSYHCLRFLENDTMYLMCQPVYMCVRMYVLNVALRSETSNEKLPPVV